MTPSEHITSAFSVTTGVLFFAVFAGVASGTQTAWVIVAFAIAVVLAWAWLAAMATKIRSEQISTQAKDPR